MKQLLAVAALAAIASACDKPGPISAPLPPAQDVEAATERKPVPTAAIVESEEASLDYDNAVEAWGERVHSAGLRVCRWLNQNGGKYDCE